MSAGTGATLPCPSWCDSRYHDETDETGQTMIHPARTFYDEWLLDPNASDGSLYELSVSADVADHLQQGEYRRQRPTVRLSTSVMGGVAHDSWMLPEVARSIAAALVRAADLVEQS